MKKIFFLAFVFTSSAAFTQNATLLGRWTGEHGSQNLILVFAANGKGVWKITAQYDDANTGCSCLHTISVPMTWRIRSNKVFIDLGVASGTNKMIKNDSKYVEMMKFCVSGCEALLNTLKADYSEKKYSDDLIFEGKRKVWMLGTEFTKSIE